MGAAASGELWAVSSQKPFHPFPPDSLIISTLHLTPSLDAFNLYLLPRHVQGD